MTGKVNELLDFLIALDGISARTYEIPERSVKLSEHWQVSCGKLFDMPAWVI